MRRMLFSLFLSLALAAPAAAVSFGFGCISGDAFSCAVGGNQLVLDVTDSGSGTVTLTLSNSGPIASAIANVYIDLGPALASVSVLAGSGVSFALGGSPPILPGGQTVGFVSDVKVAADNPKPTNGVNPGESLSLVLTLDGGTFGDVLAAFTSGAMRVGVHLIAIADPACDGDGDGDFCGDFGGSASFVNTPRIVPEPALAALLGVAALAAGAGRKLARR